MAQNNPELEIQMEQEAFIAIQRWIRIGLNSGLSFEDSYSLMKNTFLDLTRNLVRREPPFNNIFDNFRTDPGNLVIRHRQLQ